MDVLVDQLDGLRTEPVPEQAAGAVNDTTGRCNPASKPLDVFAADDYRVQLGVRLPL